MNHPMIGKNVIVRSHTAGVHAGTLETVVNNETLVLTNTRRLWRVYTRDASGSISDIAANGLKEAEHSIGALLKSTCIVEPKGFEISEMTDDAHKSVMDFQVK